MSLLKLCILSQDLREDSYYLRRTSKGNVLIAAAPKPELHQPKTGNIHVGARRAS
jgi:hypothetical protein